MLPSFQPLMRGKGLSKVYGHVMWGATEAASPGRWQSRILLSLLVCCLGVSALSLVLLRVTPFDVLRDPPHR